MRYATTTSEAMTIHEWQHYLQHITLNLITTKAIVLPPLLKVNVVPRVIMGGATHHRHNLLFRTATWLASNQRDDKLQFYRGSRED